VGEPAKIIDLAHRLVLTRSIRPGSWPIMEQSAEHATDSGSTVSGAPVVVVVGAGPGVGMAVARRFAREGFAVGLVARNEERLRGDVTAVLAAGAVRAEAAVADVGDEQDLRAALAALRVALGAPDVLALNTSMFVPGGPLVSPPEDVLAGFRVGVLAALVAIQESAPAMVEAGHGSVLITGGGLALSPSVWSAGLSIQKAGVRSLAYTAAAELAPSGVHVGTVTIDGVVGRGDGMDPDSIAERFWELHAEPAGAWTTEIVHSGPWAGSAPV
jgi:NAD(P)-dependent dehydrogenase (short-subunit alcohol dehydrogenase family)